MGKKKHAEEHVNLERWLISYADFITLLFATFVVLYALAQVDISEYTKLEDSIRKAFAAPAIMQGSESIFNNDGQSIMESGSDPESQAMVPPMLEYVSQKYEQTSFEDIKKSIDSLTKTGDLQGVDASIHDRGLIINLKDNLFFHSGTAALNPNSYKSVEKIGNLIKSKFSSHLIRVEGHTDNLPQSTSIYPSNWELSASRASSVVRFLLQNFKFKKDRFASVGYADTRPVATNSTESGRQKNRRVEIVVLRNKFAKSEPVFEGMTNSKIEENSSREFEHTANNAVQKRDTISDAAKKLVQEAGKSSDDVIVIKGSVYEDKVQQAKESLEKFEEKRSTRSSKINEPIQHKKEGFGKETPVNHVTPGKTSVQKNLGKVDQEHNLVKNLINKFSGSEKLIKPSKEAKSGH